jgi:hypothetical protein
MAHNYDESEAVAQFLRFLANNKFVVNELDLKTNKDERAKVEGDKSKKKSGRYKLFLDEKANGWCINYLEGGEFVKWNYQFTPEEKKAWAEKKRKENEAKGIVYNPNADEAELERIANLLVEEEERKREEAKAQKLQKEIKEKEDDEKLELILDQVFDNIEIELDKYTMECTSHPYLTKKRVFAAKGLRKVMVSYSVLDLLDDTNEKYQMMEEDDLVITMMNIKDTDRIVSYQSINEDGKIKKFRLNGQKHGAFFIIGAENFDDLQNFDEFNYTEGYATGASIWEMINKPIICCFDVGNMITVARTLQEMFPHKKHTICSDNDYYKYVKKKEEGDLKAKNVGLESSMRLREETGIDVVFPVFPKHFAASDWNDLTNLFGLEMARKQFFFQKHYLDKKKDSIINDEKTMKAIAAQMKYEQY